MNLNIENQIGARFKLVVRKSSTNKITKESSWFTNIVLDTGLNRMGIGTWIDRCCVGAGNSTPVATQTQLDAFKASTTTSQGIPEYGRQAATSPIYYWARKTWRFGEGMAAGNLSEVGLGWGNTSLWNRALIKDGNGNPTTITVLSDEYLDVISEIRVYPKESITGSFNFLNKAGEIVSTHTYSGKPLLTSNPGWVMNQITINRVTFNSGNMGGSVTSEPSGSLGSGSSATNSRTDTAFTVASLVGLTIANGTHKSITFEIQGMLHTGQGNGYQMEITPPIIKTADMELTYKATISWGRYTGA